MSNEPIPQQPYFLRALYEWCVDSGLTPYITVRVDKTTRVPQAYVQEGQIVLNIGPAAVRDLNMDNLWVRFSGRFGGVSQVVEVPVVNVVAVYARETGEGMAFQVLQGAPQATFDNVADVEEETPAAAPAAESTRPKGPPSLRVVK